jgi:hypothetical protein
MALATLCVVICFLAISARKTPAKRKAIAVSPR